MAVALALAVALLFAWHVRRWAFLGDDAFISFRYARNLAEGAGLTWNPGERVEGYSNFLWVLILAAGIRLGLAPELLSQALGILAGALILVLAVDHGRRSRGGADPWIWLPAAWLAANRSFAAWSTGGLETQLFALFLFAGGLALIRERERDVARPWLSSLCFALACLTRPEGPMFVAVAGACLLFDTRRRRRPLSVVAWWALPIVALVGAHLLWRWSYYGALLPNTFHAKVNGLWWEQGVRYLALFAGDYRLHFFAPILLLPLLRRRSFDAVLWSAMVAAHLTYVTAIGGDRFEFRFLVFVLPAIALLLADGLRELAGIRSLGRAAPALAVVVALASLATTWIGSHREEARRIRSDVSSVEWMRQFAARRGFEGRALRDFVDRGLLPAELRIAVTSAGALPYYSRLYAVDYHGLTDAAVARTEIPERGVVGHEHKASVAYMRERGVVAFDALDNILHRASPLQLAILEERLARYLERRRATSGAAPLAPVCLHVENDRFLIFATPLDADEAVARFPRLARCSAEQGWDPATAPGAAAAGP